MLRHIQNGKIVNNKRVSQTGKCNGKKHKLAIRQRPRGAHQHCVVPRRADNRQYAQAKRQKQSNN